MSQSSAVQFMGIDAVLMAFKNRDAEAWSISAGKQFLFKDIGYDTFARYIKMLYDNGSGATYTVKVYDDIEDKKLIKDNTPADGSFNFKLNDDIDYGTRRISLGNTNRQQSEENAILAKLDAMEARLNKLQDEAEPESKLGVIGEIIEHPAIAPILPAIVEMILGAITGKNNVIQPPQQSQLPGTAVNYNRPAVLNGIDEDKIINEALQVLKKHDENLAAHLQKLATIAETDNASFQILLTLLK